ncbi:MAG: helix-turn-helix transcriptional regulator [Planctomycetes bacterium]|nr:helix-turn-helix transcriptional regulator [Planctomycetota bacterium]
MTTTYRTMTGRRIDLGALSSKERDALAEVEGLYEQRPDWTEFARTWPAVLRRRVWGRKKVPVESALYRVCQDMELRLGVAQGQVAPPDYRDHLADLIEEKFGSRYAFCRAAGLDQGNLSHVLAGRKDFSLDVLRRVAELLDVQLDLVPTVEVYRKAATLGPDDPAERLRQLSYQVSTLESLEAKAAVVTADRRASVVPPTPDLFPDGLEGLRTRLRSGQDFGEALAAELGALLREQAQLARQIARSADRRRELVRG